MAIKPYTPPSNQLGKLGSIGAGIATGNPLLIAGGIASGTPGGAALTMAGNAGVGKPVDQAQAITENGFKPKSIGIDQGGGVVDPYNAIDHKIQQDPNALVAQALKQLEDPSIPQEYRDQYAEPLLRFKHYGNGRIG